MLDIGPCPGLHIRYVPRDVADKEAQIGAGCVVSGRAAAGCSARGPCRGESHRGGRGCRGLPPVGAYLDCPVSGRRTGRAGRQIPPAPVVSAQVAGDAEVTAAEMRRQHPKWGAKRIRLELLRRPRGVVVPAERTINRIPARQGLVSLRRRKRPRDSYRRWERPGPMQLWQIDIAGGVMIADKRTGELREANPEPGCCRAW